MIISDSLARYHARRYSSCHFIMMTAAIIKLQLDPTCPGRSHGPVTVAPAAKPGFRGGLSDRGKRPGT